VALAACRDEGTLVTSQTTTTSAEVQRRQPELPVLKGVTLSGVAEQAGMGAASGAISNAPTGGIEPSTAPPGPPERIGNDPLDANRTPVAGPERIETPKKHDGGP
jgi:hypothetical protein